MIYTTQPEVLDEIKALFSWNPPRLIRGHKEAVLTSSTTTRPPAFYDKHFSTKLVLKSVERLPSLVKDLAKNVDKTLDDALTTLPSSLRGFVTAEDREEDVKFFEREVTDKKAVAMFYHMTTGRSCLQVASTLALHSSASFSRWPALLYWTQSGPSSCYAIKDGLANIDGLLRFRSFDQTDETWAAVVESMESRGRRIFKEMQESKSALATWEIQSPCTGAAEIMKAVLNLGKFSWTFCTSGCRSTNDKHWKAKANVKLVAFGCDAQAPPWSFPDNSLNTSLVPENLYKEINRQPLATLPWPVTRRITRSATSSSSTLPPQSSVSRSSECESPTKSKGKKRKRDEMEEKEGHDKTAQSLAQQAWAHAVRVDGTVIVLHSGNHEIVCIRHRGSQTLYVSDVIEPPTCVDPGYGKIHVGIYIAAVQDMMNRKQQQLTPINQPKPPCDSGNDMGKRKGGGFQCSPGRKAPTDDELVAIEKMIDVASNRNVVLLYLQYDVYDSLIPASFLRCSTPPFSSRAIRTYGQEECLTIVLTSEIGRGATGVAHRGTLKPEICDGAMSLDVVVKLAFDTEKREALRSEYEVYCHLRSKGVLRGIPTVLGLFDNSEDSACALVMLYAGVPLVKKPQRIVPASDRKSALSTLKSIHRAGILHGDIRRDNILMGDSGLTIIDFGHSEECDDQEAKDKEFGLLRYLLGFKPLATAALPSH